MATKKKLLQAAAGNAGGGAGLDVERVFSTFLYEGNGASQRIENGINLGDNLTGPYTDIAKPNASAVGGYLYRNSDLSGNADGKTLTFSGWAYSKGSGLRLYRSQPLQDSGTRFAVSMSNALFKVEGYNSSNTKILDTGWRTVSLNSWFHFLISVDLSNTSNRYLYINDVEELGPSSSWDTYTNDSIDFTNSHHYVNAYRSSANNGVQAGGGLAQIYLDYTYRDLSVVSNRRTFVTADIAPAGNLSSLNPILYLPFDATNSTGSNLGTGGDFVAYNTSYFTAKETGGPGYDAGSGEGGLVWTKNRDDAYDHNFVDSARGLTNSPYIRSNTTGQQGTDGGGITQFNSNGYTMGNSGSWNANGNSHVSWTFLKSKRFFDIQTWTGNGTAGRTVSHNLGSVPGCIIVKKYAGSGGGEPWEVYHRGVDSTAPEDYRLTLNSTSARSDSSTRWNDTAPTSTEFTLGNESSVNGNSLSYVAYLFAHNDGDGEFGPDGDADIIKCGSYTGNGSATGPSVNLGFEPQWLLIRNADRADDWVLIDAMRGIPSSSDGPAVLRPESDAVEYSSGSSFSQAARVDLTATGFDVKSSNSRVNGSSQNMIYISIRRGTKVPESATEVFDISYATDANDAAFPVDLMLSKIMAGGNGYARDRLRGGTKYLLTDTTNADLSGTDIEFDDMTGTGLTGWGTSFIHYNWKRASNYMDCVAFTGTGSAGTHNHNLTIPAEMMWVKSRAGNGNWFVYHSGLGATKYLFLNETSAAGTASSVWNDTAPTSSVFSVGASVNQASASIAYLFASLTGISKVGSVTHSGTTNVDCGFSSGARWILIKRTDAAGDWYVWDSERGIVSANSPYLLLNTTGAEVTNTDYIDPLSSGFTITDDFTDGDYIFYAIA